MCVEFCIIVIIYVDEIRLTKIFKSHLRLKINFGNVSLHLKLISSSKNRILMNEQMQMGWQPEIACWNLRSVVSVDLPFLRRESW